MPPLIGKALGSMGFSFFRPRRFKPAFPIVPLQSGEEEARELLAAHASVADVDPGSDSTIAHHCLVADDGITRVTAGIWDGRVRFMNYLTEQFNDSSKRKMEKLRWFVDHYGGRDEFDDPQDTGYMIFWRNPVRKIMIVFGLHMGPVRIIDQDDSLFSDDSND